jgi:hypothetical protein
MIIDLLSVYHIFLDALGYKIVPFIYGMAAVVKTRLRYALKHQQMTLHTIQTVTYLMMFIYILFYSLCLRKQYR